MITTKELKTLADFESIKLGDFLAVEWRRDYYFGNVRTRFAVYQVVEVNEWNGEVILQKKNNAYFNYRLILGIEEGQSNAKNVTLVKSVSDV